MGLNCQGAIDQRRSEKTGKILVHFSSDSCISCIYREHCPIKIGVHKATLNVDEAQYAGRQSRHRNENGSRLQLILARISFNMKHFFRFTKSCAKNTVNAEV